MKCSVGKLVSDPTVVVLNTLSQAVSWARSNVAMRLQECTGRSPLVITWQRVIIAILLLSLHLRSEPSYSAVDNVLTIQTSFQGRAYLRDSFFFPPDTMTIYLEGAAADLKLHSHGSLGISLLR